MNPEINTKDRVVVGTDGSPRAEKAVDWAAERATALKMPLTVLHVIPSVDWVGAMPPNVEASYKAGFHADAERRDRQISESLRARHPDVDMEVAVVEGHPAQILTQATKDAAMVVLGARGETAPLVVKVLGGVTDQVAAHAEGPIAVISDEAHENPQGPVVVGVDASPQARAAIKLAFDAAEARGVPLVAVHAFSEGRAAGTGDMSWVKPVAPDYLEQMTETVHKELADEAAQHPTVPVEVRVVRARPQEALVEESKQAGLVVVGSRGLGGFRGLLMGSTSKHLIREAHCPVVVTRG